MRYTRAWAIALLTVGATGVVVACSGSGSDSSTAASRGEVRQATDDMGNDNDEDAATEDAATTDAATKDAATKDAATADAATPTVDAATPTADAAVPEADAGPKME